MTPGKAEKEGIFREDLKGLSSVQMYNQPVAFSYHSLQPLPIRGPVSGGPKVGPAPGGGEDDLKAGFRPILPVLRKSLNDSLRAYLLAVSSLLSPNKHYKGNSRLQKAAAKELRNTQATHLMVDTPLTETRHSCPVASSRRPSVGSAGPGAGCTAQWLHTYLCFSGVRDPLRLGFHR